MNAATSQTKDIASRIFVLREHRAMMDADLAGLYGVPTGVLIQAVKRKRARFPPDFMYAFTEQGVAMLSSVLRSTRAIAANIAIMRAFVRLREMAD